MDQDGEDHPLSASYSSSFHDVIVAFRVKSLWIYPQTFRYVPVVPVVCKTEYLRRRPCHSGKRFEPKDTAREVDLDINSLSQSRNHLSHSLLRIRPRHFDDRSSIESTVAKYADRLNDTTRRDTTKLFELRGVEGGVPSSWGAHEFFYHQRWRIPWRVGLYPQDQVCIRGTRICDASCGELHTKRIWSDQDQSRSATLTRSEEYVEPSIEKLQRFSLLMLSRSTKWYN